MMQGEDDEWAAVLTGWWETVGRLKIFPKSWSGATMSPLYKHGDQANPANCRPVSLLSHILRTIDASVRNYVSDGFSRARIQFDSQAGGSVQQEIFQAQSNAQRGLQHVAVLDFAKAYDKVDCHMLLEAIAGNVDENCVKMVLATLGLLHAKTKGVPTNYGADITRGVPHGARSSPLYLNMYINELALEAERNIRESGAGDGAVVLVANDFLLQASSESKLQEIMEVETGWA